MGYSHATKGKMRLLADPPAAAVVRNGACGNKRQSFGQPLSQRQKQASNSKPSSATKSMAGRQSSRSNAVVSKDNDEDEDEDTVSLSRVCSTLSLE